MINEDDIQKQLDSLLKPPGSLGRLEWLAGELCRIQQTLKPETQPRSLALFAGDHGVVESGVSSWPSSVTTMMVKTILAGQAASSVLAKTTNTKMTVVDVGMNSVLSSTNRLVVAKVKMGTNNLAEQPAMSVDEFNNTWNVGQKQAENMHLEGTRIYIAGEMGIGNSTSAACITSYITGIKPEDVVGRGAGITNDILARKKEIVTNAVNKAKAEASKQPHKAVEFLAGIAGLEIVAMAGFYATAHKLHGTILIDGFISTAGALIAEHLQPGTTKSMLAAHRSAEPGHTAALEYLNLQPILDGWNMRLGEGTGALTALPMLDLASSMMRMATFKDIGL